MPHLKSMTLGAALALASTWLLSAATAPAPQNNPSQVRVGGTLFGLCISSSSGTPLAGLDANTPVTISKKDGNWILIDYPTMKTSPIWLNVNNIVAFRNNR